MDWISTWTPLLQFIAALGAALGVIVGGMGIGWRFFGRRAMRLAIEDSLGYELGANGDDKRLPEAERNRPLRSLVISSRVDAAATRQRLEDGDQRFAEIGAAQKRLLDDMERHMAHHGVLEAAYDEDRRVRGLPPVEDIESAGGEAR